MGKSRVFKPLGLRFSTFTRTPSSWSLLRPQGGMGFYSTHSLLLPFACCCSPLLNQHHPQPIIGISLVSFPTPTHFPPSISLLSLSPVPPNTNPIIGGLFHQEVDNPTPYLSPLTRQAAPIQVGMELLWVVVAHLICIVGSM